MADENTKAQMTEKQKVKEITDKLEAGLKELFESEKYKSYLSTMSKFHDYSFNNTLLIALQKPEATLVAGYQAWQKNFERHVNKGEKAIRILAPAPYKIKEERDKLDPVTGELMFDENGIPQKEEVEITIPAFRAVSVFDVSQTDGKPIPELEVNELLSTVEGYEDFVQALMNISPVPIAFEDIPGDFKGYFNTAEKRIAVQENMSESQTLKTMVHEVAHSMLHDKEKNQSMDISVKDRNTKEVEAESVAFTVCRHFGIDTSDYSFGYIAGWGSGRNMKELKSSLDIIQKIASELITGIEGALQELQLNREMELEQSSMMAELELDGDEIIDLGDETEQVLAEMKKTLESNKETELAFSIADRYISIQEVEGGYNYSIMGTDYKEIDGGIYDNSDVTIREALHDILEDLKSQPDYSGAKGNIQREDELIPMDYDELMEKAEEANRIVPENTQSSVVADFKAKTNELFYDISEMNPAEIEETIKCHVQAKLDEYGMDAITVDVAVVGKRCRGLEQETSDLDVVVELSTNEREDVLFDIFNEDGLHIGDVKVDINPITAQRTGTLETYLPQVEEYLASVREARKQEATQQIQRTFGHDVQKPELKEEEVEVTLTVAECSEFHNLGEFYENIPTVEEAAAIWRQIPPERINGIPAIGIRVHRQGEESYMDDEIDLLSDRGIDLEILEYIPSIKNEPKAIAVVTELVAKFPDIEIDGVMSEEMEAKVWEMRMPDLTPAEQLAVTFDRLSYDYDRILYHDSTQNMTENVSELAERIKQGDTEHLTDWLKEIISEGAVPEETERAKKLLEKLAEYKPLVKIEELEEQNYNMIDNVLNNGAEKPQKEVVRKEKKLPGVRTSLKVRLAEKKTQIAGQSQETMKNKQREM